MSDDPFPAPTRLTRRDLLGFAARGAAGVVVSQSALARSALARAGAAAPAGATVDAAPACVLTAALTEGPFFVDEKLLRSDIRADPTTGAVSAGVPLSLTFHVSRAAGRACTPLTGAYLDVWHADSAGRYSDVAAGGFGPPPGGVGPRGMPPGPPPGPPPNRPLAAPRRTRTRDGNPGAGTAGRQFLRGYQVTDARGIARFLTVYPGWYEGRAVHIHFKLRLYAGAAKTYEFTSQFFFDDALTDAVHAHAPYDTRGGRDVRNADDGIYTSLAAAERRALTLQAAPDGDGYAGVVDLGVRVGDERVPA